MEVSYKGHVKEVVTAAWWKGAPVAEIWLNGEKLYPLDGDVATELVVDVGFGDVSGEWIYWVHALDYHEAMLRDPNMTVNRRLIYKGGGFIKTPVKGYENCDTVAKLCEALEKDYVCDKVITKEVYLWAGIYLPVEVEIWISDYLTKPKLFDLLIGDTVYKEGTDFEFNANTGLIEFKGGQYPNISSLPEGTKVKLRASVPEREKPEEKTLERDGQKYYSLPLLPGTQFRCGYTKGGKKNPAGMTIHVNGHPSGEMFVSAFGNLAGHWSGGFGWFGWAPPGPIGNQGQQGSRYNDKWTPGDTGYTVQVWNHYDGDATAYPKYPAFTKEWSLDVVGVIIKQV